VAVAAVYLAGALLFVWLVRRWRPDPSFPLALGYVALVAALFAPVVFGGRWQTPTDLAYLSSPWKDTLPQPVPVHNRLLSDGVFQMLPFRALVRERLLHGELPLWAPELGTGQPLLANGQSAPFAPLSLLALPLPAVAQQNVLGPWRVLLALLLMHALLGALGAGRAASAFGAIAFALTPFTIAWLNHPHTAVSVLLPGVVLGVVELARAEDGGARRRAFVGLFVCAVAAALGGHPETLALVAVAATLTLAFFLIRLPRARRLRFLRDASLAALLAGGVAAPVLLPLAAAIPASLRSAVLAREPLHAQPPPFRADVLETLVQPDAFGNPVSRSWSGPQNFNEYATAYTGLLTLALGLAAASVSRRGATIVVGAALALAVAFRVRLVWDLWLLLPVLGHAANGRLRLLWVFGAALAAALVVDRLPHDPRARRRALGALAGMLLLAVLFAPRSTDAVPFAAWIAALVSLAAATATLAVPRWRGAFALCCATGLLAELVLPAARYQAAVPHALDIAPAPELRALAPPPGGEPFRTLGVGAILPPGLGALAGVWDPRANDPMRPAAPERAVMARINLASIEQPGAQRRVGDASFLGTLGVRFLLTPRGWQLEEPWRLVRSWGRLRVWENAQASRLFFVAPETRSLAGEEDVLATSVPEDWRRVTVRRGEPASEQTQSGEVTAVEAGANAFTVYLSADTPLLVASSVSYDSGWRVSIDGIVAKSVEVNGGFLGFTAPAGARVARLVYRPASWVAGCWLCLFAGVMFAVTCFRLREAPVGLESREG